jgi:hypothetical protein
MPTYSIQSALKQERRHCGQCAEVQRQTITNIQYSMSNMSTAASCLPCASSPPASEVPVEVFLDYIRSSQQFLTVNASKYAPRSRGGRWTRRTRCVTRRCDLSPLISQLCIVDDRRDHPIMKSNQPLQGESNFGDSSGPLFLHILQGRRG